MIRRLRRKIQDSTIRNPRIELICVGTELLTGKVNTHTSYIGQRLSEIGLSLSRDHSVGDDPLLMHETFSEVFQRADVVLCAGGLGPTFDDITRDVWSRVLKRPLISDSQIVADIREKFRSRGIAMPPMNRRQALVLRGATTIENGLGTAPGQILEARGKILALLPGPSRELAPMIEAAVLPRLKISFPGHFLKQHTFRIFGVAESLVDQRIRPWVARHGRAFGCKITHGILASQSVISVKFSVEGVNALRVEQAAEKLFKELRKLLGDLIFGEGNDTLETVVARSLCDNRKKLAVAESCTGGTIAKLLTDLAGASDYFTEGIVTYSNQSKVRHLGVRLKTLEKYGAVSKQVAKEMAEGVRRKARSDYSLSVTGIAGPGGGTDKKPVGLVYIGCAGPRRILVREFRFKGERGLIRHRASLSALDLLRREIKRG